ncbi:MAG TPA: type II toxin-antitoxin system HicB family antitoxin [Pirellulales bacterium]|jgi:predicted RNase H-like HicB family nuclease|nr:type II toxin-antitoxin system HicB family antitoxin [Pirellulales bacterium]
MSLSVEIEQEDDGRWLAEVLELDGVLAYGATREEAVARAEVLALRVSPTVGNTAKPYQN